MRIIASLTCLFLCVGLIVIAPSCTYIHRAPVAAGHEQKVKENNAKQQQKIIEDTTRQAHANITNGEYKKALDRYSNAYDRYHYSELRRNYAAIAEQIRRVADVAFQKRDFEEAGIIYNTLFESGITTRDFAQSLSFDDDDLQARITLCSKALMENGLMKYREEKLDEAIAIWKKTLDFDPENMAVKNALETATLQRQKLKSLK